MLKKVREKLIAFVESNKDVPFLVGLISGLYPFLFFYSNNYPSVNSWYHVVVFLLIYVGIPLSITLILYYIFGKIEKLSAYRKHLLFVLLIFLTSLFMSQAVYMTLKKKILLGILILACIISKKMFWHYKKLIVLIAIMAVIPFFKTLINIYEGENLEWTKLDDDIANVKFRHKPNIYMIQPDGYVSRQVLEQKPYNYKTDFYDWLGNNGFKVYKDFRSNYPASLTSNASMFAMKHHYFNDVIFPQMEMPNAREAILDNNVVAILKNNGYETFYLGQDEYFQQNLAKGNYDHYNIKTKDIPLFTKGDKVVRDVYADLEESININNDSPKFIFLERLLPHHVHFNAQGDRKQAERKEYLDKIEQSNVWLIKAISLIKSRDKNALIIVLADHGGWVGMENAHELLSTNDKSLIYSTFGNLAAIDWNKFQHHGYDENLKTNVNVFRVLFSCLSENKSYLNDMQEDASYNIRPGNFISQSIHKLIDEKGNVVDQKH
jgi:hypothetical protein